jgi:hypothetical protein
VTPETSQKEVLRTLALIKSNFGSRTKPGRSETRSLLVTQAEILREMKWTEKQIATHIGLSVHADTYGTERRSYQAHRLKKKSKAAQNERTNHSD